MNLFNITEFVVLEADKMGEHKDLFNFDKGHIVMARRLDRSNFKTRALVGYCLQCLGHTNSVSSKENR